MAYEQGLCYVPGQDWLVISLHFDNVRPSMLAVVDLDSGNLRKSLTLLEANGSPHFGHVGGLAAGERHLFVTSNGLSQRRPNFGTIRQIRNNLWLSLGGVYRITLEQILKADEVDTVKLQPWFIAESMAGALTLHDQVLWVAEFVDSNEQLKIPSHRVIDRNGKERFAWICGYRLNDAGELRSPGRMISKPLPPGLRLGRSRARSGHRVLQIARRAFVLARNLRCQHAHRVPRSASERCIATPGRQQWHGRTDSRVVSRRRRRSEVDQTRADAAEHCRARQRPGADH